MGGATEAAAAEIVLAMIAFFPYVMFCIELTADILPHLRGLK